MNNSRILLAVLGGVLFVMGLFFFNKFFWTPWSASQARIEELSREVEAEEKKAAPWKVDRTKWTNKSLPRDFDRASAEYGRMLKPLLRDCGLTVEDFKGPPPQEPPSATLQKKLPRHSVLTFQVRAKGSIESVAKTLESLQRMPVMHRVSTLTVERVDPKDRTGKLGVNMTIEAMIVALPVADQAKAKTDANLPKLGEIGPAMKNERKYADMALRNPFLGYVPPPPPPPPVVAEKKKEEPPPEPEAPAGPDVREFIRLDTITRGEDGDAATSEAFLINLAQRTPPLRLRSAPMSGYDTFRIMDEDRTKTLLKAKVLRIDHRDVYYQVGDDVYGIHFNQSLADSLLRPLSESQMKKLDLKADEEFAKTEADAKKGKKTPTKKGR